MEKNIFWSPLKTRPYAMLILQMARIDPTAITHHCFSNQFLYHHVTNFLNFFACLNPFLPSLEVKDLSLMIIMIA